MKKISFTNSFKTLTAAAAIVCSSSVFAQTTLLDEVVAVVDDDVVMSSERVHRIAMISGQLRSNNSQLPPEDVLREQILEQLVIESIQLQLGDRIGINITRAEINQHIARMQQSSKLSNEQFLQQLAREGISLRELQEQIRRDYIINEVQNGSVNRRIQISEQEVQNFLKSKQGKSWSSPDYRLGHILVALPPSSSNADIEAAKSKTDEIAKSLRAGADFRSTAVAQSDAQDALQGGDLGWRKAAQMPVLFADAIEELKVGELTTPLRSGAGFHILKLYEMRGATEQIIEQAKVRHILISPSEILNDKEAYAKLEDVRQQIIDGADFEVLAKEHSEDVGSMLAGGDLGWSLPGKFVPEFEEAMKITAVGEISKPFRSQFGWHILKVDERRQQDMTDRVRENQARNLLRQRRFDEERINWLSEIRDEAFVKIK